MTKKASSASPTSLEFWKPLLFAYLKPSRWRASWQIFNSVGSYLGVWLIICLTAGISWWLTLPLCALAGALLVRVFIIFHDCGHGSFFASRRTNNFWGIITGVLAFTPYYSWREEHAVHHGSNGNLDRRGTGDIWTMTVREYLESPRWKRVTYRIIRNPIALLTVAPLYMFLFDHRMPGRNASPRARRSVWWTNGALLGIGIGMSAILGFLPYLIIQLTVMAVAGSIGISLFYLQHQFKDTYWERGEEWDYLAAALKGSTFLKLPRVLQWFTGNIGFHHIHHLDSRIPNYNLQACHESHPMFQDVTHMTMFRSVEAFRLGLWDEGSRKLVRFRQARRVRENETAGCR